MSHPPLDILVVEDNPADARLVREMLESEAPFEGRLGREVAPDASADGSPSPRDGASIEPEVQHVNRLSAGIELAADGAVDIVLLDLNLPKSQGLETLEGMRAAAPTVPIVVFTGVQDRSMGLEALDHGAQEYLVKDEVNTDLLVRTIFHAIQRAEYERILERQHEQLSTLYDIGVTAQDIAGSLIDYSTREEIEATVCARLADSDVYQSAWIGAIDRDSGPITDRAATVPAGFLEALPKSDDETGEKDPVKTAVRTQETQVLDNIIEQPPAEDYRTHAREFDYRAMAAVPIAYEGAMYGVLALYAKRMNAFASEEVEILGQLGNVIGHAITAVERKAALMNEAAVELDLVVPDFVAGEAEVEFLRTMPAGDGEYLQYASVPEGSEEGLVDVFEQFPEFQSLRAIDDEGDRSLVEISYDGPPVVSTLASHGGRIRSASLKDGDYSVTVNLPADAEVRSFIESVRETNPGIDLIAQRSVEPDTGMGLSAPTLRDEALTDKQLQAIEAAYFAGYFDQPRRTTGEEVADSLDITASTFHQHLQAGLRNLLAAEFEESTSPGGLQA